MNGDQDTDVLGYLYARTGRHGAVPEDRDRPWHARSLCARENHPVEESPGRHRTWVRFVWDGSTLHTTRPEAGV